MRVLVTGGAGYIGSHTCKFLAEQGHDVLVYDNLSTGHRDFVRWGNFEQGDILDGQRLQTVMQAFQPHGVIHFAAKSQVGESVSDPGLYIRNNVGGTLELVEAMRACRVGAIVVSGTCAVYGQPDRIPIVEECPKSPLNPYGATKLFMEQLLADMENAHGLRSVTLRYFNAAGCDELAEIGERHEPESHLIPRALMAISGHISELAVFGNDYPTPDGTCIRDYIHVHDLARAHVLALEYLMQKGASCCLNLGTGRGFSVKEILEGIERVTERKVPHTIHARRAGDPAKLVADASKALSVLGWKPTCSDLEHILRTAWTWHCKDMAL